MKLLFTIEIWTNFGFEETFDWNSQHSETLFQAVIEVEKNFNFQKINWNCLNHSKTWNAKHFNVPSFTIISKISNTHFLFKVRKIYSFFSSNYRWAFARINPTLSCYFNLEKLIIGSVLKHGEEIFQRQIKNVIKVYFLSSFITIVITDTHRKYVMEICPSVIN